MPDRSPRSQLGRADLLRALAACPAAPPADLAAVLGYADRDRPAPLAARSDTRDPPPAATTAGASPPPDQPPPTTPAAAGQAPLHRVTAWHRLDGAEDAAETPSWLDGVAFDSVEPVRDERELLADPARRPPPRQPLAPWPRLWPFLRAALGAARTGNAPDLPRLVALLARGHLPRRLPRRRRRGWADQCQLVVDKAEPLRPFWSDFDALGKHLQRLRGHHGLVRTVLWDEDPAARCPIPAPGTPLLVLGDLGCLDPTDLRRRQWRRLGLRLRQAGCRPVALMPCPPRWWQDAVAKLFFPACWDRAAHLPLRLDGPPARRPGSPREAPDPGAEALLTLLAPAIRVEPALLRAVRQLLPAATADVGSEAAAWSHEQMRGAGLACGFAPGAAAAYRARFAHWRARDEALCRRAGALLLAHHAHLSPAIAVEEAWNLAELLGEPPGADLRAFLARMVRTQADRTVVAAAAQPWNLRYAARQQVETLRRSELAAALWVAAHRDPLHDGEPVDVPDGVDLERFSWLLAPGCRPERRMLRQRGRTLCLERDEPATPGDGLDAPGSPLAVLEAAAPVVRWQWLEDAGAAGVWRAQPLDRPVPLRPRGRLRLRTDRHELTVEAAHSHDARPVRQLLLALGVEQALACQAPAKLLEGELQRPASARLELLHDELQIAARLVHGELAVGQHLEPVFRIEDQAPGRAAKQHRAELTCVVLEREVGVARGGHAQVAHLARDPEPAHAILEQPLQPGENLADAVYGRPCGGRGLGHARTLPRRASRRTRRRTRGYGWA